MRQHAQLRRCRPADLAGRATADSTGTRGGDNPLPYRPLTAARANRLPDSGPLPDVASRIYPVDRRKTWVNIIMRGCTRNPRQVAVLCALGFLAAGCASVPATPSPTATQFTKSSATPAHPTPDATTTQPPPSPFDSLASYLAGRPGLVTATL